MIREENEILGGGRLLERLLKRLLKRLPERLPERLHERLPESLPESDMPNLTCKSELNIKHSLILSLLQH